MTLVLGMIGSDGIVLSADGRATFTDGRSPENNYRKIYPISDVYVGYAARGITPLEDITFLNCCRVLIQKQSAAFSVAEYSLTMAKVAEIYFARRDKKEFEIGFIIAGYDKDKSGSPTTPHVYRFLSLHNYIVEDCPADKEIIYLMGQESTLDKPPTDADADALKDFFISSIRKNECETVGGDIRTVTIKGDDVQETLQQTN